MSYALLGKVFVTFIVFIVVWVVTTITANGKGDWGDGMAAFFFVGPILGVIVAVLAWYYFLPPL
jgi:small-conductance mechanosensitive channel